MQEPYSEDIGNESVLFFRPSGLFDHILGCFYFSKDSQGRFVYCNRNLLSFFKVKHMDQVFGKTDFDFLNKDSAQFFNEEDKFIMRSGKGYSNQPNKVIDSSGNIHWFTVTKLPLMDVRGCVVGIEGFMEHMNELKIGIEVPSNPFKDCLEYVATHYNETISIQYLAQLSHMSKSTFSRKFRERYRLSPSVYIKRFRLERASQYLKAGYHLSEVANRCGFCDQSHFTKDFRNYTKLTPKQFQYNSLKEICLTAV